MKKTFLFVCSGNTCRSCMAEIMAKDMTKKICDEKNLELEFNSAGLSAIAGDRASVNAREALLQIGLSADNHRAKNITIEMVKNANLILTMQKHHRDFLIKFCPDIGVKTFTLKEFAYDNAVDIDVQDPYGRNLDTYINTREEIKDALKNVFKKALV